MYSGTPDTQAMAGRIKAIRKALNLSQKDFAEKAGISATLVSKLESGERTLTDRTKTSICLSCGVGEKYLMDGEGEMFSNTPPIEIINQLAMRYGLCDADKIFLISYLEMPNTAKKAFVDLLLSFIDNYLRHRL